MSGGRGTPGAGTGIGTGAGTGIGTGAGAGTPGLRGPAEQDEREAAGTAPPPGPSEQFGPSGQPGPSDQSGFPDSPYRHVTWQKLTLLPAFLVALLLATWLWFKQADLDPISENALADGQVTKALWQHVELTVISTFFVLIISIPLGVLLTRRAFRKAAPAAMAVANTGQARRPPRSVCSRCW